MKIIKAQRRSLDLKEFKMRAAREGDYDTLITESTMVVENGVPLVVYVVLNENLEAVVSALRTIRYEKSTRTAGLPTVSRIFGFSPRVTLRKDFCSSTSLAVESPEEHRVIADAGHLAASYYQRYNPDVYQKHMAMTLNKVQPEYRIGGTPFTSGIINKNNPLRYHFDSGNFKNVWSAMFVFKSRVGGGHLAVPELGLGFELCHKSLLLFDGQGLLHGVTPIERSNPYGFRYSIVYYSLRQMWNCLPVGEELARIRKVKTEREAKRAGVRS